MKHKYKVLDIIQQPTAAAAEEELNKLGAEGWWLAGVVSTGTTGSDTVRMWFVKTEDKK